MFGFAEKVRTRHLVLETFLYCGYRFRFPTVSSLLAGGQSQSWLVGHNIISITTSGCTSNQLRNGLCDRCSLLCKAPLPQRSSGNSSMGPTSPETVSTRTDSSSVNKRYTKASLQHTRYVFLTLLFFTFSTNIIFILADKSRQVQLLQYHHQLLQRHIIKALKAVADSFVKHQMMRVSAVHLDL